MCLVVSNGCPMEDEAELRKCAFGAKRQIFFGVDATFWSGASFSGARFNNGCFENVTFEGNALFLGAEFNKKCTLKDVIFKRNASFENAKFGEEALFEKLEIEAQIDFKPKAAWVSCATVTVFKFPS